jgi:ubiquinone/menaquinone biosynthesis C-methylase UbiE
MARERARITPISIQFLEASAETIPLDDRGVDTVVTTWTLCIIPDAPRARSELRRVRKPASALLFVEHERALASGVARWQLWSRIVGGCHLNRKILIAGNGFRTDSPTNARLPGPRTHTFLYEGRVRST